MGPLVVARDFTPRYYYGMSRRGTVETSQQQRGVKTQQQRGFITLATTMAWPRGTVETTQQQRGVKTSTTAINLVVARVKNPHYYYGMSRRGTVETSQQQRGVKTQQQHGFITIATTIAWSRGMVETAQQQRGVKTSATAINLVVARVKNPRYCYLAAAPDFKARCW